MISNLNMNKMLGDLLTIRMGIQVFQNAFGTQMVDFSFGPFTDHRTSLPTIDQVGKVRAREGHNVEAILI